MTLEPYESARLANLCGQCNEHLKLIEQHFPIKIYNRGNLFEIEGNNSEVRYVGHLLSDLYEDTKNESFLTPQCVHLKIQELRMQSKKMDDQYEHKVERKKSDNTAQKGSQEKAATPLKNAMSKSSEPKDSLDSEDIENRAENHKIITQRKEIKIRGKSQKNYIDNISKYDINFGIGPAGTGKTYLAVASAVKAIEANEVQRILLVRPAVEAGEKLGFLPGDLSEKVNPYLRPLYDALYEMLGFEKVEKLVDRRLIEVTPLAYMRGRTLNNAFIILDESQNTTTAQMKMFLTRIGFGSKAVITGDQTQIDLPQGVESGLIHAMKILHHIKDIGFSYFSSKDVVRHSLVRDIIEAYHADEQPAEVLPRS